VELREAYTHAIKDGNGLDAYTEAMLNTQAPMFWRGDIEKWLSLICWKEDRYFIAQEEKQEKALTSRERDTLLKLVIGMAVGGYGHDVMAKKTDTVSQIILDIEKLGLSISDETARKYLKEAAGLLPRKPHKG
jgi:hypothetical protein